MEYVSLSSLWLPVLLSGIVVFFASALVWMVIRWHESDWSKLPDEDAARAALKGVPQGEYAMPHARSNEERAAEAWQTKCKEGPVAMVTVFPNGLPVMGKQLGLWFVYCLVVSGLIGYVLAATMPAGASYLGVFRVAGAVGFVAYAGGAVPGSIWFGASWGRTSKDVVDGLIYGLLTAGVFGWLWP